MAIKNASTHTRDDIPNILYVWGEGNNNQRTGILKIHIGMHICFQKLLMYFFEYEENIITDHFSLRWPTSYKLMLQVDMAMGHNKSWGLEASRKCTRTCCYGSHTYVLLKYYVLIKLTSKFARRVIYGNWLLLLLQVYTRRQQQFNNKITITQ